MALNKWIAGFLLLLSLVMLPREPAIAQAKDPLANLGHVPDNILQSLQDLARKDLPGHALENGTLLLEETDEQKKIPVLPVADAKRVVERAAITGYASICGLHWKERSYHPFMNAEGLSGKWTERQMIYMDILFGITQNTYEQKLKGKECPKDVRAAISKKMLD